MILGGLEGWILQGAAATACNLLRDKAV